MASGRRRRTPMGLSDAKASNNLLVGLGIGIITAVTGLSAAGTFTAINAMNRQSEDAIAEAQRHQQQLQAAQLAAQTAGQGQSGSDQVHTQVPAQSGGEQDGVWTSDQIKWMQSRHITYDEYGLPRDEDGNLMNDPTTDIYDPSRVVYFFEADGSRKTPFVEGLPQQDDTTVVEDPNRPVYAPDVSIPSTAGQDGDGGMGPIRNPAVDIAQAGTSDPGGNTSVSNPNVENPGQGDPGGQGGNTSVSNPNVENPGHGNPGGQGGNTSVTNPDVETWWINDGGDTLPGLRLNEDGKPYYTAKDGDTLDSIGNQYGFTAPELAEANDMEASDTVDAGDDIWFPVKSPDVSSWWLDSTGTPLPGLTLNEDGKPYYVAQEGDSLGTVGSKYGFTRPQLAEANDMDEDDEIDAGDDVWFPTDVRAPDIDAWWLDSSGKLLKDLKLSNTGKPYYTAKDGDTLNSIGKKYGFTAPDLADANNMETSDPVSAGDDIGFPTRIKTPSADTSWWFNGSGELLSGLVLDENGKPYYVVKSGDSLGGIGARYGFTYPELAEANHIDNPSMIYKGDIIRFPNRTKSPDVDTPIIPTLSGNTSGGHGTGNG